MSLYRYDPGKADPDRCPVQVSQSVGRWTQYAQCSLKPRADRVRPVRTDFAGEDVEIPVCGRHASVYDKAEERHRVFADQRNASEAGKILAEEHCRRLAQAGITARPEYRHEPGGGLGYFTGRVIVDGAEVFAALARRA